MDLRKAAEAALEFLPSGDYSMWPNPPKAVVVADNLRAALSQHYKLAEAVELLRSIAQQDVARHKSYEAFTLLAQELAQDFTRRYDAAQQEQPQ